MRAENLYNGVVTVGCRFSFTIPVEMPARRDSTFGPLEPETTTNLSASSVASE